MNLEPNGDRRARNAIFMAPMLEMLINEKTFKEDADIPATFSSRVHPRNAQVLVVVNPISYTLEGQTKEELDATEVVGSLMIAEKEARRNHS